MRLTRDGNSFPVPAGPARELIDSCEEPESVTPDGFALGDAYRVVWKTAEAVREATREADPVTTPWMRMSEEEKAEIRAARRRSRLTVLDGVPAETASTRRAA